MKDILADLFFGSCSLCYFWLSSIPVLSENPINKLSDYPNPIPSIENDKSTFFPNALEKEVYEAFPSISSKDLEEISKSERSEQWLPLASDIIQKIHQTKDSYPSFNNISLWHLNLKTGYILSSKPVFKLSMSARPYWAVNGNKGLSVSKPKVSNPTKVKFNFVEKSNSLSESSFLSESSAGLIVSGGDKRNLESSQINCLDCARFSTSDSNLKDFRGGIAFNQGVSKDFTVGVGFFYNKLMKGFGKVAYKPKDIPVRATFSLLNAGEDGAENIVDVKSEISFEPTKRVSFNYHGDGVIQKFDLKWKPLSNFNFIVESDSKERSVNTKVDLSLGEKEKDLYFFASVNRKIDDSWEWEIKSNLKSLQLKHKGNSDKTNSEVAYGFGDRDSIKSPHSLFINYETLNEDDNLNNLIASGWRYHSLEKLGDRYKWQLDLGYGFGSEGNGFILSGSKAFSSELALKVSYQQVSLSSDEGNFKIELSSQK
jgi:hypothetical protein